MKSKQHEATLREINNMNSRLEAVSVQAIIVSNCLDKVTDPDEADELIIEIGKLMDRHAKDMENI